MADWDVNLRHAQHMGVEAKTDFWILYSKHLKITPKINTQQYICFKTRMLGKKYCFPLDHTYHYKKKVSSLTCEYMQKKDEFWFHKSSMIYNLFFILVSQLPLFLRNHYTLFFVEIGFFHSKFQLWNNRIYQPSKQNTHYVMNFTIYAPNPSHFYKCMHTSKLIKLCKTCFTQTTSNQFFDFIANEW
jgi:hypothetical protein